MSKYMDLAERVKRGHGDDEVRRGIDYALEWLDRHPERVSGRTITESEAARLWYDANNSVRDAWPMSLLGHGITVVPDPEPTNAEKLEQLHDQYRMFPAQHLPGNGSFADYLDYKGVKAPDHD